MERARHRTNETPTVVLTVPRPRTPPDNNIPARPAARRGRRRAPSPLLDQIQRLTRQLYTDVQRLAPLAAVAGVMFTVMAVAVAVWAFS